MIGGEDIVRHTIESERLAGRRLSEHAVAERVSRQFGGAEVAILRGDQGGGLVHIDQAFVVLRGGKLLLNTLTGVPSAERDLLEGYREQLEYLGYEILELPNSLDDIRAYRNSANLVPFRHFLTGEDHAIFPVFLGEVRAGATASLGLDDLVGKAAHLRSLLEAAGYKPLPVLDLTHIVGGNTHCIANVLQ